MHHHILLKNFYLDIPTSASNTEKASPAELGTVLANMAYYGYAPKKEAFEALQTLTSKELSQLWTAVEPAFAEITGDNRNMSAFVVYSNFPADVLSMSQGEYWVTQLLMYWGVPSTFLAGPSAPAIDREKLVYEQLSLKQLALAPSHLFEELYANLQTSPTKWTTEQEQHMRFIHFALHKPPIIMEHFGFKLNGITLLAQNWMPNTPTVLTTATDVLRFAAALSGEDPSLRQLVTFRKFARSERKALLEMLDGMLHLEEDVAMRPSVWKKLFRALHPGDYAFANVIEVYDKLYRKKITSLNQIVAKQLTTRDKSALTMLANRPGEFLRRFHVLYDYFESAAIDAFKDVAPKLSVMQLLKLQRYLLTVNNRKWFMYAPKGNWSKVTMGPNNKVVIAPKAMYELLKIIGAALRPQLTPLFPQGVSLPLEARFIKLQTNDQELATYGRGTSFPIPEEAVFIRAASFWKNPGNTVWYDNGFNFFSSNWEPMDTICWNNGPTLSATPEGLRLLAVPANDTTKVAAVFSGDPVNSAELEGRACQMIDLYLTPLREAGVRYAVWNILAYSRQPFSQANDVLATLQWGTDPQAGELYEPARAQMVFPLKGNSMTKYVALVDLEARRLIYLDANLPGKVMTAKYNEQAVSERMPAYLEYLDTLPSVEDYFSAIAPGTEVVTVEDCLTGRFRKTSE